MNIPDIYQRVEYLESSGTQYIDTRFVPEIGDTFDIDYKYTTLPSGADYQVLMSAGTGDYQLILLGVNKFINQLGKVSNGFYYKYFATGLANLYETNPSVNEWYNITINSNGTATSNGQTLTSTPVEELDGANTSLYLFIRRDGTSPFYGAIRKFQMSRNGALVHNMIPARRNSDNVLGMYDTVSGKFFTNAGTGTFIAGPDVNPTIKLYKPTYEYGEPVTVSAKPTEVIRTQATDYAPVKSMKGNTVKWNQLVENGDFSNGTTGWSADNGSISMYGDKLKFVATTSEYNHNLENSTLNVISGHKYYMVIDVDYSNYIVAGVYIRSSSNGGIIINRYGQSGSKFLFTSSVTNRIYIRFMDNPGKVSNKYVLVKTIELIDLTAIFGSGNEPTTVEAFESWLSTNIGLKDYYPYDAGSLLSVNTPSTVINDKEYPFPITTMKDIKGNVMFPNGLCQAGDVKDEIDFEHGTAVKRVGKLVFKGTEGNYALQSINNYGIANFFRLLSTVGISAEQVNSAVCNRWKHQSTSISDTQDEGFIAASNKVYFRIQNTKANTVPEFEQWLSNNNLVFYYPLEEPITYHFDTHVDLKKRYVPGICNAKGSTKVVGAALVPYNEFNNLKGRQDGVENAALVTIFPDGMKKAGSVCDEIKLVDGVWKAVKKVGSVDLGSFDYDMVQNGNHYYGIIKSDISNCKTFGSSNNNVKCPLNVTTPGDIYSGAYGVGLRPNEKRVNVSVASEPQTDSALNAAVKGVILYYELATPITYTIDASSIDMRAVSEVRKGDMKLWENNDGYGVKINTTTGACERIGNMEYHKTLPIQSRMRRCIVGSDDSVRYVHPDNYLVDTNGNAIDYTVSEANGVTYDVMVEIPEHYYDCYQVTEDGTDYDIIMLYPEVHKGKKVPLHYMGAFKAAVKRNVTKGTSTAANEKLFSTVKAGIVYNSSGGVNASDLTYTVADREYYRGGDLDNAQSSWDNDKQKSLIGKPVTQRDISEFATMAKNRGSKYMMLHWAARNCLNRLFVVEYATLNSHDTFNDTLTVEGYHQGGLGLGVSNFVSGEWKTYNGYYPLIPCGITLRLGSKTGVVAYNLSSAVVSVSSTNVPSYRGIESPFGDIWEMCNGLYIYGADNVNNIFTAVDGWNIRDFMYGSSTSSINGYQRKTNTVPISVSSPIYNLPTEGWITDWKWDSEGTFTPKNRSVDKENTQDSNSPMRGYLWGGNTGAKKLLVGGVASSGVRIGLFAFNCASAVTIAGAHIGSRLLKVVGK